MVKTALETEADIYKIVKASRLGKEIRGKTYRKRRPADSKGEDIVIRFLAGTMGQFQKGVVIINIYVTDILLKDGTPTPDLARLTELERASLDMLRHNDTEYDLTEDESPTTETIEGLGQTVLTIRLRYLWVAR